MTADWKKVKQQVATFRDHSKDLPTAAGKKAIHSILFTKEEIEKLLNQKNDGHQLDGIRVYLGGEMIDGHMVTTMHAIACEKDTNDNYHDYKIDEQLLAGDTAALSAAMPLLGEGMPCPPQCSKTNFLNS
ncbi:MAG TPA: hypothetical protein PLA68_01765 [Panacibacter sp.]|nr:hypothetical protein [Panacibacter sp.]